MAAEPAGGQVRHLAEGSGLGEQVGGVGNDREPVRAIRSGGRAVEVTLGPKGLRAREQRP